MATLTTGPVTGSSDQVSNDQVSNDQGANGQVSNDQGANGPVTDRSRHHHETTAKLLLVDDDCRLAMALSAALQRRGYEVVHARTAAEALAGTACDLVLLDLGLPDGDGVDLCRTLRSRSDVGIIIVTARGEQRDRVLGLEAGADDYIVKPFGLLELQARLQAVLRRYRPHAGGRLSVGSLQIDVDRHQAYLAGKPLELTRKEFHLLVVLARTPGIVVARQRLVTEVWQTEWLGKSRTLDVHIATLRAKIEQAAAVESVRGVGYRLVARQPATGQPPSGQG